jgi:hypothetical protein
MPSSTGTLVFNDQKIQAPDMYVTESLGVGVSDPTSNLEVVGNAYISSNMIINDTLDVTGEINLRPVLNTASIKYNSNVIIQYAPSSDLIQYPKVAMASAQSGLNGGYTQDGYTIEASSEWSGLHSASNAFNHIQSYQPTDYCWLSRQNTYGLSDGLASSGSSKDTFQGIDGSWLGIILPVAIRLDHIDMYNRADSANSVRPPKTGIVWASNDGTSWTNIFSFNNLQNTDGALNVLQVNNTNFYTHYRVQITAMHNSPQKEAVGIGEFELYGIPENDDPSARDTNVIVHGRIGVGTTEPRALLDVNGEAYFSSPININGTLVSSFTGKHLCFPDGPMDKGLIVSANKNKYVTLNGSIVTGLGAIKSDESLPVVSLCNTATDVSVFGVVHDIEIGGTTRPNETGGKTSKLLGDNRVIVNSLGEGAMWVTNTNGNLISGDYITTSNITGYGQKQDDDILHSYTVAKITMDCDFNPDELPVQVISKELDSQGRLQWEDDPSGAMEKEYKIRYIDASGTQTDEANAAYIAAFVGCTYHCG